MRPKIFDLLFHDDRMFVLEVAPVESQDMTAAPAKREWAVITRRNVPGYPPVRVDSFSTKDEAVTYYKRVIVETPRVSLGNTSPDPIPDLDTYAAWLVSEDLYDPVLNPNASRKSNS